MKFVRLIFLFFLFSDACVEPLDLDEYPSEPGLVVNGMITDKPGPYTVTLHVSSPANTDIDRQKVVSGASITLYDDAGNQEQLTETKPGNYQTAANGMRGVVGKSYHIRIVVDEKEYVSKETRMLPAGSITEIFGAFEKNAINHNDISLPQDALRIYVNAQGEPGYPNLFRWRWSGIYQVMTYPELNVRYDQNGVAIPDPLPCSGFIYDGGVLRSVAPCECCVCWVEEAGDRILVSNNQFVENGVFNKELMHTFPVEARRFFYKYRIVIDQLSVDEDIYNFWRLIEAQQNSGGDIFQPNTIRIKGNVTCVTHPKENVMGIFAACSITEKAFTIPRSLINVPLFPDTLIADCRQAFAPSTNVRPPFW
jgi:hypothetical protein